MILLHQFAPAFGLPNGSPFCMKLEGFLKLARLPYRTVPLVDLASAPKGKGPFVEVDGQRLADSALVIRHLEQRFGIDLDAGLTHAERAAAHAFGVMLEERTYFAMLRERWLDDANWPIVRDGYLGDLPLDVQDGVRDGVRARLDAQGIGLHASEEVQALAAADIAAVADWLGDKPCFMGAAPTKVDATVHAFVCNLLGGPFTSPLKAETARHANLVAYNERLLDQLWPRHATAAV